MSQDLRAGDFLVFQLEAGFGLLRLLAVDENDGTRTYHVAAYEDFFPDVDMAEAAALEGRLKLSHDHLALTERAFESTQTARIINKTLDDTELAPVKTWAASGGEVSDRSVRLLLGLR